MVKRWWECQGESLKMNKRRFLAIRTSKPYLFLKDRYLYWRAYIIYQLNPYPKKIGENPVYIFNHIPKCGGTSLNIVLRKWFHMVRDYPPHDLQYPDPKDWEIAQSKFENNLPIIDQLKPFQIMAGHYLHPRNQFSKRIIPRCNACNMKKITFVRDPIALRLSLYKFGRKKGHQWVEGISLKEFIISETNFLARTLECDDSNFKEVLDSYFFIGLTEDFERSMRRLAKKINRPIPRKTPFVNCTNSSSELEKLDKHIINLFKKKNELDYKVYEYSKKLFEQQKVLE